MQLRLYCFRLTQNGCIIDKADKWNGAYFVLAW